MAQQRIVCWFSCGAASAVATKIAIERNKKDGKPLEIVYTRVREEHPDNERFLRECEAWFGTKITVLENKKYNGSIVEVFERNRYMAGISGAPCTLHLKKDMRREFQRHGDIQVFGYTAEEQHRVDRFLDANADAIIWPVLVEEGISHDDCLAMLAKEGIDIPAMYKLGYRNNNCIGCVKGGAGYWNKIRDDFPEVFAARCEQSRRLGARLIKHKGIRIYLDELPRGYGNYKSEPSVQCGILCELTTRDWHEAV